jgi:hypothetical protein
VDGFAGFEPQVGQIRALRTFRVGPGGALYPLFSDTPWSPGVNTARCLRLGVHALPQDEEDGHAAPHPGCRCGFYAYGSEAAAGEYPYARHVRAVVSCWGRVIAGTRGLRAEHCRIEALWLSRTVPRDLAAQVAAAYPAVPVYPTAEAMLAAHPLTELDCYEPGVPRPWWRPGRWLGAAATAAVVLGLLPMNWLGGSRTAGLAWGLCGGLFLVLAVALGFRRSADTTTHRRCMLSLAVVLWMLAPFAGATGFVLIRLPLMEVAGLTLVRRLRMIRAAGRFPATIG